MELGFGKLFLTTMYDFGGALPYLCLSFPIHETIEL